MVSNGSEVVGRSHQSYVLEGHGNVGSYTRVLMVWLCVLNVVEGLLSNASPNLKVVALRLQRV
jgi:hypothetical protein